MTIQFSEGMPLKIGLEAKGQESPIDPNKPGVLRIFNGMQSKIWVKIGGVADPATKEDPVMYSGSKDFLVPAGTSGVSILGEQEQEVLLQWGGLSVSDINELPPLPSDPVPSDTVAVMRDGKPYQVPVKAFLSEPTDELTVQGHVVKPKPGTGEPDHQHHGAGLHKHVGENKEADHKPSRKK